MDLIFETSGGTSFSIEVGYFDSVLEIKQKIEKHKGFPVLEQTLVFNGNILPDDLNVHNSDILHRSQICLLVASDHIKSDDEPSRIRLLLKLSASKTLPVEMDIKDTIHKLKEKIHEITEGISVSRLVIHANGAELADQKSIQDCELLDNSEVMVGVRTLSSSGNMSGSGKLRVVLVYGAEKMAVEVNPSENVGEELRKKLEKTKVDLPRKGYFFIYKQNVMDDIRSFKWHHVGQGDIIEIFSGSISGGS